MREDIMLYCHTLIEATTINEERDILLNRLLEVQESWENLAGQVTAERRQHDLEKESHHGSRQHAENRDTEICLRDRKHTDSNEGNTEKIYSSDNSRDRQP